MNFPQHLGISFVGHQDLQMIYTSYTNPILQDVSTVAGTKGTGGGYMLQGEQDENGLFPCGYTGRSSYANNYKVWTNRPNTPRVYGYGSEVFTKTWNEAICDYEDVSSLTGVCLDYGRGAWLAVDQEGFGSFPGSDNRLCRNTTGGVASGLLNSRSIYADEYAYGGNESVSAEVGTIAVEIDITNNLDPVAVRVQPDRSWHVFEHVVRDNVYNLAASTYISSGQTTNTITTGNQTPIMYPIWGKHGEYASLADALTGEPYEKTTSMIDETDFYSFYGSSLADIGSYGANVRLVNHVGGRWRVTIDYSLFIYDLYTYQEIQTVTDTAEVVLNDLGGFIATASFSTSIPSTLHGFYQTVEVVKYEQEQMVDDVLTWVEVSAPACDGILVGMQRTWFAQRGLDSQHNSESFYKRVKTEPKTAPRCGGGSDHDRVTTTNDITTNFDDYGNSYNSSSIDFTVTTDVKDFVNPLETTDEVVKYEAGEVISIANANHTTESYTYLRTGYSYLGLSYNDI